MLFVMEENFPDEKNVETIARFVGKWHAVVQPLTIEMQIQHSVY